MAVVQNSALEERRREIQKKRKAQKIKRRKRFLKRLMIFFLIVGVITLAVLSLTVFFPVEKITVSGEQSKYTVEQIIKASGMKKGENLWMTGLGAKETIPEKLPYISDVEIKRSFPSSISIKTKTAKAVFCFKGSKDYFICDEKYKILEKATEQNENLLIVSGSDIEDGKPGKILVFKKSDKQNIILDIIAQLKEHSVSLNSVDITESLDINLKVENRFSVKIGSSANLKAKLAHLAGMIAKVEKDVKGSIDLSDYTPENHRGILTRE